MFVCKANCYITTLGLFSLCISTCFILHLCYIASHVQLPSQSTTAPKPCLAVQPIHNSTQATVCVAPRSPFLLRADRGSSHPHPPTPPNPPRHGPVIAQAAYLIGVADPSSTAGEAGLLSVAAFRGPQAAIVAACDGLLNVGGAQVLDRTVLGRVCPSHLMPLLPSPPIPLLALRATVSLGSTRRVGARVFRGMARNPLCRQPAGPFYVTWF